MDDLLRELALKKRERGNSLVEVISADIRQMIQEGTLPLGSQLPGETELAEVLGVSRGTLRAALNSLSDQGLIIRRRGVGTFVTWSRPLLQNNLHANLGVTELIKEMGLQPGCSYLNCKMTKVDEKSAGVFSVARDDPMVVIERVRTADEQPVVLSIDQFPQALLARMTLAELETCLRSEHSIYTVFEKYLGRKFDYGVATISPVHALGVCLAQNIVVQEDTVLLLVEQVDYDSSGQPLLLSKEYHLPDFSTFTVYRKR